MSEWQNIETAPKDEMILAYADGMMRLLIWDGRWLQVGARIEPGWFMPTHWQPLPPPPQERTP